MNSVHDSPILADALEIVGASAIERGIGTRGIIAPIWPIPLDIEDVSWLETYLTPTGHEYMIIEGLPTIESYNVYWTRRRGIP